MESGSRREFTDRQIIIPSLAGSSKMRFASLQPLYIIRLFLEEIILFKKKEKYVILYKITQFLKFFKYTFLEY